MSKLTKYKKRIKLTYACGAALTCFAMLLVNPVISDRGDRDGSYYTVIINGDELGMIDSEQLGYELITDIRKEIAGESDQIVFMDYDMDVAYGKKLIGKLDSLDEVKKNIYNELKSSIINTSRQAFTIKIDDFSITLESKEAVLELLDTVKNQYDEEKEFSIELIPEEKREFSAMVPAIDKASASSNEVDTVSSEEEKSREGGETSSFKDKDGLLSIEFEEQIEIAETYTSEDKIVDVSEAVAQVTKEREAKKIYEVVSGDCLSVIAEKNDIKVDKLIELNELESENAIIQAGDELVVTVPEPELSVIVNEQITYEEEYQEPVQYIENDEWYNNRQEVVQEGSVGYREVSAVLTLRNGKETEREVVNEEVVLESKPTIIEVGTKTPPTFIKPISGGRFTSGFGARWGRKHKGIDWACPTGTAVKASSAGTVTSAGWSSGYGYCVTIKHSDGKQTRYAHLSKILVKSGQSVSQGEKIALSGNTGNSTGPHVHFEIIVNGAQVNPFDYLN